MEKCIYCGTPHKNKSEASHYQEVGDACQSCEMILKMLNAFVLSVNMHAPSNVGRPNRKLTIKEFTIEKI